MADALERVRAVRGDADVRELIVLGAEAAVRQAGDADRERREQARQGFLHEIETGEGIDIEAFEEVRRHGFSRRP